MKFKKPDLTDIWNEAVHMQNRGEHNIYTTNKIWGALTLLEKYGLCKLAEMIE